MAIRQTFQITFGCLVLLFDMMASGQEISRTDLENKAVDAFYRNDFASATEGFENLHMHYEREPSYNYYLGRCYLHQNLELDKAVKMLKFAASKSYNADVHFYLGLVYYKTYDFRNAKTAYKNFEKLAKKSDLKKLDYDFWLQALNQLEKETEAIQPILVTETNPLPQNLLESLYAGHIKGKLVLKPDQFRNKKDREMHYQSVMYLPPDVEIGDFIYVSGYSEKGKGGTNIYQIKRLSPQDYRFPTLMGADDISTAYNEAYPYYDEFSKTLYFCSDRPGGFGGFDIYRSVFNAETHQFEKAERMPFPINTPFDDILFIPDTIGVNAIFSSNRQLSGKNYLTYKYEMDPSMTFQFPATADEIAQLADFSYVEEEIDVNEFSLSEPVTEQSSYQIALSKALEMQLRCDSISAELHRLKNLLRAKADANERRILIADITLLDSEYKSMQSETDLLFAEAERLKPEEPVSAEMDKIMAAKGSSSVVTNENILREEPVEQSTSHSVEIQNPVRKEGLTTGIEIAAFEILSNSPYSKSNPIPTDVELPNGLVYRIQLGVFTQEIPMNSFGGLTPITAEEMRNGAVTKYYVGYFNSTKEARTALKRVKSYGFDDAFIVPYYNRQKIAITKAREIEFAER